MKKRPQISKKVARLLALTTLVIGGFFITYAVLAASPAWDQSHFWFRDDDGNEKKATGYGAANAAVDANVTNVPRGGAVRVRLGLGLTLAGSSIVPQIEYKAGTTCTGGTWTVVSGATAEFLLRASPNFTNAAATTKQITIGTFTAGKIMESANPAPSKTFSNNRVTEYEWSLQASSTIPYATTYAFRITNNGVPLNTYTACGTLTTANPPLPTATLSGSPSTIVNGNSSTLTWTTTNATSASINNGVGAVALNGSTSVSPTTTTVYVITATNVTGNGFATSTITVTPAPPVVNSFTATPSTIVSGNNSTLSWATTNATTVIIDHGVGSVATNGVTTVAPTTSTAYLLTATGPGGTATSTVFVTVTPAPPVVNSFTTSSSTIQIGNSATLNWTTTSATLVSIDNGIGAVATSGSQIVTASVTTTYTLTAVSDGGTVTSSVTITVLQLPIINSFTATPSTIVSGNSANLAWSTSGATTASINQGIGAVSTSGIFTVSPIVTTIYTLSVSGLGGTVTQTVTVTVTPAPPVINSFTATPSTIVSGNSADLSWSTTNATSVNIDQGIGAVATSGTQSVSPTTSITYVLTATGPGGTVTQNVTVTVTPAPPVIDIFTTSSSTIQIGNSATLNWTTTNATSASIDNGVGVVSVNGSKVITPSVTTTYILTATSAGGTVTSSVTITVLQLPVINSFTATPSSIVSGNSADLTWSTTNATAVSLDHGIGSVALSGTFTVSPATTRTYTLTVSGLGGTVTQTVTVTVTQAPPVINSFTVSSSTIAFGDSAALNWSTTNATSTSIDNGIGAVATSGSQSVSPTTSTTYTLIAASSGGTVTATVSVTVLPLLPVVNSFTATPSTITVGGSADLTWSTSNATSASIDNGIGPVATSGARSVSPSVTTTYTVTATGAGGTVTSSVTVTVLQLPVINSFTATPSSIVSGNSADLTWSTTNATSVTIDHGIGSVAISGTQSVSPTTSTTYLLTATGPGGVVTQTVVVTVTPPVPVIGSFTSSTSTIQNGQSATLNWATTNATTVSLDNGIGSVATSGSQIVSPASSTTYTLTASSPGGSVTASVTITVTQLPVINSFTATPPSIVTGNSADLGWATTDAISVSIDHGIGAVATSGMTSVSPTTSTTYLLTATGPGGTTTQSVTLTVTQPLPVITLFTISSSTIAYSASTTLAWVTSNTTDVSIDNGVGAVATSDAKDVFPASSTTYVLTATGPGGTVTQTVNVTVLAAPVSATLSIVPTTMTSGSAATLTWTSTNATTVSIDHGVGTVALNGSFTVVPLLTTTYTLTATGTSGSVTETATVTVTPSGPGAPTVFISASPTAITSGDSATLNWSTTNATSVSIDNGIGSVALSGSQSVSPTVDTTYVITATGTDGTTQATVTVTVSATPPPVLAPTVDTLALSPATIDQGQSTILSWQTSNAASVSIDQGIGSVAVNGTQTVSPTQTTIYTITATGTGGTTTKSVTVTVNVRTVLNNVFLYSSNFSGKAYPGATVFLVEKVYQQDVLVSQGIPVGESGTFLLYGVPTGYHAYSLLVKDAQGRQAQTKVFDMQYIYDPLTVQNILISPTVELSQTRVSKGKTAQVVGYAFPGALVRVEIDGRQVGTATANPGGDYTVVLQTNALSVGQHTVRVKQVVAENNQESDYSRLVNLSVSAVTVVNADLNGDGKINVQDWSIFLSRWQTLTGPARIVLDINGDGKVDLADFATFLNALKTQ